VINPGSSNGWMRVLALRAEREAGQKQRSLQEIGRSRVFLYGMQLPETASEYVGDFRLRLRARPSSLAPFRDGLREWLQRLSVEPGDVFDVVLACSECLTLVVDESPRRVALVVDVSACMDGDTVVVVARDYGLWHEAHAEQCEEPLSLSLMRALMDSVEWERHPDGQTIALTRRVRSTTH
jgi:anti-sigma regulatory factor (Ser/Thr protein kinase)